MSNLVIPTIGDTGFYSLKAPFDALMLENAMYTCQAIRRISDYIAYNEDVLNDIYIANGLKEADFETDQATNTYIISLQSSTGQWLYVPVNYILSYPVTNGVQYQTFMIGVSLGAVPKTMDLSPIQTLIGNLVYENFGIKPKMSPVALSKPILVSETDHKRLTNARLNRASQKMTDYGRYKSTLIQLNHALSKISELEAYIKEKHLADIQVITP